MTTIDPTAPSITEAVTKPIGSGANLDKEAFLKLLVAQLKYQSPDSPMDSSAFMAQTAQFSQMETMQNMAKIQSQLLNSQQSASATGMLGQKITFSSSTGAADSSGVVTGVKLGSGGPILKVGDMEVPIGSVKEVNRA